MGEDEFTKNLDKYNQAISIALKMSRLCAGIEAKDDKSFWATVLHTKICTTGVSLLILSPESPLCVKKAPHWDFSTMFTLTRNLIECLQTFFYLCVEEVDKSELEGRKSLFNLHDYYSRKKMFSFLEQDIEDTEIENQVILELNENEFFKKLDIKQQKHFLKGENAFFISREDIEERMGNDKGNFKLIYKLFSSNTHSFPMGFYGMLEGNRGTGVKSPVELGYSALALDVAQQYVNLSSSYILKLYPDSRKELTEEEIKTLE